MASTETVDNKITLMDSTDTFDNTPVEKHVELVRKILEESAEYGYDIPISLCLENIERSELIQDYIFMPHNSSTELTNSCFALLTNQRIIALNRTQHRDTFVITHHLFSDFNASMCKTNYEEGAVEWCFYFKTGSVEVKCILPHKKVGTFHQSLDRLIDEHRK